MARFAERAGRAPGVAFRLTRASVLAAAEARLTLADVLGVLRDASSRPIPPNVEREITGWFASVRRVHVRRATLLDCPDEETAARAVGALGARLRRLTPTVLELPEGAPGDHAALLRRLRAAGVFVDGDTTGAETGRRGRPSTRRRR